MPAFGSGISLQKFIADLRSQMPPSATISIAAHSLGNIVVGSALQRGMTVDNYVMLEAAASSSLFYPLPASSPDPMDGVLVSNLVEAEANAEGENKTPFDYQDLGYRGYFQNMEANINGNWCNYYSTNDFWLRTGKFAWEYWMLGELNWVYNNLECKPNSWEYDYKTNFPSGLRCYHDYWRGDFPVMDEHEAMAFMSRSRTYPVGGEGHNPRIPGTTVSLDLAAKYGFGTARKDHSGQFQRDIQKMYDFGGDESIWPLYRRLLTDLNVAPSTPPKEQP